MPTTPTYPGVYIGEIPGSPRTIAGVSTSVTAFIDCFARGPVRTATRVTSFAEFERWFGGLSPGSEASYGVWQYFLNGGSEAWIVRIAAASATPAGAQLQLRFRITASSPGAWGNRLRFTAVAEAAAPNTFALQVEDLAPDGISVLNSESYAALSTSPEDPRYCVSILRENSALVRLEDHGSPAFARPGSSAAFIPLTGGNDGAWAESEFANALTEMVTAESSPLKFLNTLCIPAAANLKDAEAASIYKTAAAYCRTRRALLIIDVPPSARVATPAAMIEWRNKTLSGFNAECAAVYYPRLLVAAGKEVGASGTVAGIYAATDANRGVWKAPAGTKTSVSGSSPAYKMNDSENGLLNPLGINAIRIFPAYGTVIWGARTLSGNGGDEWKYISVRRLAHYIENSLAEGLAWAVFEPNAPALWNAIVQSANAFLDGLFRQGAFQGVTPSGAYFLRCDATTTTPADIDKGRVNITIGFAPLKPAEFVMIQLQQVTALPDR